MANRRLHLAVRDRAWRPGESGPSRKRGSVMVEFALVFVLFLVVLLTLMEFARGMWTYVSGRISKEGEVDHFAVEVPGDHELHFEMVSSGAGFDPGITVFEPSGSWLDAHRLIRLAGADAYGNNGVNLGQVSTANLNHRFKQRGRYIVAAGALLGLGGPDFSYQLRIVESAKQAVSPGKQGARPSGHMASPRSGRSEDFPVASSRTACGNFGPGPSV